jgi:hypothetical protein
LLSLGIHGGLVPGLPMGAHGKWASSCTGYFISRLLKYPIKCKYYVNSHYTYYLKDNDKKKLCTCSAQMQLVESADAEPTDMESWPYIVMFQEVVNENMNKGNCLGDRY